MQFINKNECTNWCIKNGFILKNELPDMGIWKNRISFSFPDKAFRFYWFAQFIVDCLGDWENCLFWITSWGIWKSSENLHLYYRFRETYNDKNKIYQKPGHIVLKHEIQDAISFINLYLLFGWDVFLINYNSQKIIKISHDEYVTISSNNSIEDLVIDI